MGKFFRVIIFLALLPASVLLAEPPQEKQRLVETARHSGKSADYWAVCEYILYHEDDPRTFLWAAAEGRRCAIAERSASSIATYYDYMAEYSLSVGKVSDYMPYKQKAYAIYQAIGEHDKQAECCIFVGNYYNAMGKYDSARIWLERMDTYARTRPRETSYNVMLSCLADTYYRMGVIDSAMSKEQEAARYSQMLADTITLLGSYRALGMYARTKGLLEEALTYYGQALALLEGSAGEEMAEEKASLYTNLAVLCHDMMQKDDALRYAGMALDLVPRFHNDLTTVQLYSNLGLLYLKNRQMDKAAFCLSHGWELARRMDNGDMQLRLAAYMVEMKTLQNDPDSANYYMSLASPLLRDTRMQPTAMAYLQAEMDALMAQGRYTEALSTGKRILAMAPGRKFVHINLYDAMRQCYKHMGDYRNALRYAELYGQLNDSVKGTEQNRALSELNVKYATKEKELELLRAESRRKLEAEHYKYRVAGLVTALLALILLTVLVVGRLRKKALRLRLYAQSKERELALFHTDAELRLTRKFLDGVESERNRLARELHDGVSNDLYALELRLKKDNGTSPSALETLAGIRKSVRDISHELMPPLFSQLSVKQIVENYVLNLGESTGMDICFCAEPEADGWEQVGQQTGMAVYRIVQEVLGNVVKHDGATVAEVSMELQDSGLLLCVTDNGPLAPQHSSARQQGIGLRTLNERVEQVGGTWWTERRDGKNYCYVRIPMR